MREVLAFATADDVADAAAFLFVNLAAQAVRDRGAFYVALAGGATHLSCYRLLSTPLISSRVDWEKTQVFFGDERCVPEGHPDRNDDAAAAALLNHVSLPGKNIHRIPATERDGAERYESEIRGAFSIFSPSSDKGIPRFDLVFSAWARTATRPLCSLGARLSTKPNGSSSVSTTRRSLRSAG